MLKVQNLARRGPEMARIIHPVRLDIPIYNRAMAIAKIRGQSPSKFLSEIIEKAIANDKTPR